MRTLMRRNHLAAMIGVVASGTAFILAGCSAAAPADDHNPVSSENTHLDEAEASSCEPASPAAFRWQVIEFTGSGTVTR
jgi:hypothetical protein